MFDILCSDTIVAPATPPGEGGVAIVRLSGATAVDLLARFFLPAQRQVLESHRLYYGRLVDSQEQPVDEVMAVVMRAPKSFTREDVVEIHCHGGRMVVRRIVDLFQQAGARLAQPGEFTFRAFLNGRIDLTQAEAVAELIHARSDRARQLAFDQLSGHLGSGIHQLRGQLLDLLALVEAWIDFPEEEIDLPVHQELQQQTTPIQDRLERLIASYHSGRAWMEGITVLLLGKPNVGKSSLLNALLQTDRAIVTDVPGTTRDFLEEGYSLNGLPLKLVDTAGLRESTDPVELLGVSRTRQRLQSADLVLLVLDGSQPPSDEDRAALAACRDRTTIVVINKVDLAAEGLVNNPTDLPCVHLSALTGEGIDQLQELILGLYPLAGVGDAAESLLLTEQRHWEAARQALAALQRFGAGLAHGLGFELLALELRSSLECLDEITGETTPDEVLERVFSRFCIGK